MAVQERITVQWRVVVPANLAVQPGSEPALCSADVVSVRVRVLDAAASGRGRMACLVRTCWPPARCSDEGVSLLHLEPTPAQAPSLLMDRAPSKRHDAAGESGDMVAFAVA
jgi:hypothetical protein